MEKKTKKLDRRIKYTRKVLNDSLIKFLEQKEITRITVTEICTDADVNRSTYYAHFMDPYDQLAQLKEELLRGIVEYAGEIEISEASKNEIPFLILKALLERVEENKKLFQILLGKSADHNLQEEILVLLGEKAFATVIEKEDEKNKYLLMYAANGCFGLLYNWLMLEDNKMSAEQMAGLMAEFTRRAMSAPKGK